MRMPNKKTRHKLKMGLMVVQVLLGIIAPSISSVSKVMATDTTTNSSSDVSAQTTVEQDSSDKAATWVADAGEVLSEQNNGNTLVGAATDVDDAFVFTTSKSNGAGTIAIVETTMRRDNTMHVKVMIQKNDVITSTQDYDTTLVVSGNTVGLKDNSTGKVINITDGSQSSVIAAGGGLELIFAGASAEEGGLAMAAIAGGPVTILATAAVGGALIGLAAYNEYKIYQNNEILQTERSSTKLNTAVQQNNRADTQKYTKATQQNAAKMHGVLPNSNSVKRYSSYSGSMIDFDFKSIDTMSSNMRSIQASLVQMSANLNQAIANMNEAIETFQEMDSSLQSAMRYANQAIQELESFSSDIDIARASFQAAIKHFDEADEKIDLLVNQWDMMNKQFAIDSAVNENLRKDRELNGVDGLLPTDLGPKIAEATNIKSQIDNKNNTVEVTGDYKYKNGRVCVQVTELANTSFSHLINNTTSNEGQKEYYFDINDDQTFNAKIKLDNFAVNGSQLYRLVFQTNQLDNESKEYNSSYSHTFKVVWYNAATGKEFEPYKSDDGMVHDPIHVIPKIDPIVPDKGAVIQGQTDPNRDVEININGKWTDSVQSDDKGIFKFPPKDVNFNDSVYIEVIPKEVSGKYLEGRTIYLTMDRSSAQYKNQFLKHAQDFSVEELAKYLPEGWTIDPIVTKDGKKMIHIKDPELAKHIQDILDNSDDEALKQQLKNIKQKGKGYRIRIDQADDVTPYQHMHKYNDDGLLMNEEGEAVDYKSPEGHIKYDYELPEKSVIEDIKEGLASEATKGKWLTEGTAKKFLSTNGTFFVGLHKLDGKYYYFDSENGGLLTGNITTDKGKKLVADPDTGIIDFDMAMKIDDKYYLVNPSDLSNKTGFQKTTINGVSGYYYFDDKTDAMTSEDKIINGDKYYFEKETGRVKAGWVETDTGRKYVNDYDGNISYVKGRLDIHSTSYIFDNDGALLIGKIKYSKDLSTQKESYEPIDKIKITNTINPADLSKSVINEYYFSNESGIVVKNEEISSHGENYYADTSGKLLSGFFDFNYLGQNRVSYFDEVTLARKDDSIFNIPNIFYGDKESADFLSDRNGILVSGLQQIFSNGKLITVYYSPKSKRMLHGEYDIDEQHYSFDRKTGALATGLHVFDGKTYYVKPEGSLAMNEEQHINDSYYFFDKDGVMQTGFVDLTPNGQNKKVYYGNDGKMLYGQQKIGDDYYLFEHGTGKILTGFQNLKDYGQDKVSYFDPKTGAMVHDQIVVDGIKYKLDNASGWHNGGVMPGWTDDGTDKYYVGDDGKIMHGQQRVGNDIYLFSNDTGALQTGFQDLKDYGQDKICYFDPKTGAMVHDQVTVGGITYKLDDAASWHNGGLVSGVANVDLTKYFTKNPGQVVIKNDDFIYSTTLFTDKVKAVKAGDIVNVQAIEYSPNGYPRLKVEGGYLTANRSFVEKSSTPSRPNITVQAFVQNDGWQSPVQENQIVGTVEQGKRLEAFKVKITNMQDTYQGDAIYQAHVAGIGWQSEVKNDELAGTIDQARQVEALKMHLTGELADKYDLYYRVQVQNYGWLDWASNNGVAGTTGMGLRVEAIEFALNPKGQQFAGNTTRPSIEK